MDCASCGRTNRPEAAFCGGCGSLLARACPACGFVNAPEDRFCEGCGQRLAGAEGAGTPAFRDAGERRPLTVMFCDLVGSTELSQRLDPEELRDVTRAYQALCSSAVEEFDGRIAQLLGDGVLVYFGYPRAHEDDPLRAVNAGLRVLRGLDALNRGLERSLPALRGRRVRARIGIHTGPVVVDDMSAGTHQERLALGETVNVTSRLLEAADPDTLVLSATSRRIVGDAIAAESLGARAFRGLRDPIEVYRVLGARTGADVGTGRRPTPFVGRCDELAVLIGTFQQVAASSGKTVLVRGEPGIGKSRLIRTLHERLAETPLRWLDCRCSPYHENSALYPVLGMLERALELGNQTPEEKLHRLGRAVAEVGVKGAAMLLAELLSLEVPGSLRGRSLSPEARRRRTLETLVAWLLQLTRRQPVVLVVEDLHWVDPSTLELLAMIREAASRSPLLLILAFRPMVEPPWSRAPDLIRLDLEPLSAAEVVAMARGVADGRELTDEVQRQLVAKTDGMPLYVEELTRVLLESELDAGGGARRLADLDVPASLQSSLVARLDRLGSAKALAQLAAVIGREFSHDLVEAAASWDEDSLHEALETLVRSDLVHESGPQDAPVYAFKHALIRDTAYQSLLRSRRREHHARVAEVLESRFPERTRAQPEVVARHYEEAGRVREAIAYYQRAGELAFSRSAHTESISHYRRGLELLGSLPADPERSRSELRLRTALGAPLVTARGYGNDEVAECHARSRELCREVGEGPELYQAIAGLYLFHQGRLELEAAADLADQLRRLGERSGDAFVLQWGHFFSAVPLYYRGDYTSAIEHLDRAVELEAKAVRPAWYVQEHDVAVASRSYAAMSLWALGYPDRARRRMDQAVEHARESQHPFNLAFAQSWASLVQQALRQRDRVLRSSAEAIEICSEQGFPAYLGLACMLRGWALTSPETGTHGVDEVRRGLRLSATTGTRTEAPRALGILAEAYYFLGHWEPALSTLDGALAISKQSGSPYWDSELYRLRGEVILARDATDAEQALAWCERASALAGSQRARSLELRAALAASRCLDARGRRSEASARLAGAYDALDEGFDTPDLQDAAKLLRAWRS